MKPRAVTVLGATGSVGRSTLDLIGRTPERFEVVALTAGSNAGELAELAIRHRARHALEGYTRYLGLPGLRRRQIGL